MLIHDPLNVTVDTHFALNAVKIGTIQSNVVYLRSGLRNVMMIPRLPIGLRQIRKNVSSPEKKIIFDKSHIFFLNPLGPKCNVTIEKDGGCNHMVRKTFY